MVLSGGLTVGYNDERYFKMRTTVVCLKLSAILWVGIARGQAWLSCVMGGMVALSPAGWMFMTRRFAAALLVLAGANETVWRNFSTDVWVAYDTFVMPAVFFGFHREHLAELRRLPGLSVNPWATGSRFIISHRLLTDETYVAGLRDVLGVFRPRALLIRDEAHHAAAASGAKYAIDSQFTRAVRCSQAPRPGRAALRSSARGLPTAQA